MDKKTIKKAEKHLAKDPIMASVIKNYEYLDLPKSTSVFHELTKSIAYQQISFKAADTIYARFTELLKTESYTPKQILKAKFEDLRSVGFSARKCEYVTKISEYFSVNKLKDEDFDKMTDEEIIDQLTEIKGVGEWTVQMILLFQLERLDVFPVKDLGVQLAMKGLYGLKSEKKKLMNEMEEVSKPWAPYRSIASRYLWSWKREH